MYMDIIESLIGGAIVTAVLVGFVYAVVKTRHGKIALITILGFLAWVAASGCLAEEAKEIDYKTGVVENTRLVYYDHSVCYETSVNVDGNTYAYYDSNRWHNGTRLNLAFADDEIVDATRVFEWYHFVICVTIPGIVTIIVVKLLIRWWNM